ncbi:hypothetical protein K9859_12515, partial [Lactococcus lactis]|nr:hypothetical protein [Lactococcus lactis]
KELTTMLVPKDNQVIAYHPINENIVILENAEETPEPFIDPGLINDINDTTPYPTLVARRLLESSKAIEEHYRQEMLKDNGQERREELAEDALLAFVSVKLTNTLFELDPQEILIINQILKNESLGCELITHLVIGYSQGERWELAFLKESDFPADNIIRYLEHEMGAYYRGSLAWLNIYNSNQEVEESYIVDRESLWNNSLAEVQSLTGDPTYLSEQMYKEIEQLNPSKEVFDRFILMNNDERMKFLKKDPTKNIPIVNTTQTQRR